MAPDEVERLKRRLDRERKIRSDAERIAEELTSQLFANNQRLVESEARLVSANAELSATVKQLRAELGESQSRVRVMADGLAPRLKGADGNEVGRIAGSLRAFGATGNPADIDLAALAKTVIAGLPNGAAGHFTQGELWPLAGDHRLVATLLEQVLGMAKTAAPTGSMTIGATRHGARQLVRVWPTDSQPDGAVTVPVGGLAEADLIGGPALATCHQILARLGGQLTILRDGAAVRGWQFDLPAH